MGPALHEAAGLVAPVATDPAGASGPTRHQAAGPYWRQTSWGMYVPTDVDGSVVEQRIVEQAARITAWGAVTGWAALRWHGATFFDGTSDGGASGCRCPSWSHCKLHPDARSTSTQEQLSRSERLVVDGVPVTTVQRALFDEVRRIDGVREKANAISMAAAARLISVQLFGQYVALRGPWTGIQGARDAVLLATDDCRSPQEFRMYVCWLVDAELPEPVLNREVYDLEGRLIGIPDLLDVEAGLAGEYQGADHKSPSSTATTSSARNGSATTGSSSSRWWAASCPGALSSSRECSTRAARKFLPPESRAWTLRDTTVAVAGPRACTSTSCARAGPTTSGAPEPVDSPVRFAGAEAPATGQPPGVPRKATRSGDDGEELGGAGEHDVEGGVAGDGLGLDLLRAGRRRCRRTPGPWCPGR